ncbi:MAG: right-handed parallel beta-helix repeat-containing protein, partial [Bacteroidales bacterium]|nr:right-handed parallel beta-helix repeat-containing protein [Bacteroidales bacterium]
MRKINLILIVFCLIFAHAFSQPMSGTYTIGGVYSDYNSFNEAITALTINGVSDAIVFDIEAGNYNEQLTIPKITGASLTNTITFQSITADSSDVVLSYASTNENLNYTVKFDTCCYINFKKITLSSQGTRSYNNLIEINNAYNLGFYNCQLIGHTNNNSYESRLVYSNENINNASNIKIKNCNINYGYYGIVLNGKSPSEQSDKLEISGNVFRNQYREVITVKKYKNSEISNNSIFGELSYNGLYFKNCLSIDILNNLIKADAHTGIGLFENNNQFNIKNNVIYNFRTYGIHVVHSSDIVSAKPRISNNFISGKGIGIYIFYSPYYEIYHNSINSDGLCMDIESSNVLMKNNILHNKNNGSCINISSSSNDVVLDYNNLYATGAIFGTWK